MTAYIPSPAEHKAIVADFIKNAEEVLAAEPATPPASKVTTEPHKITTESEEGIHVRELSRESIAAGTRFPTEQELAATITQIASLPLGDH